MSSSEQALVLPRPGQASNCSQKILPGLSEAQFVQAFGKHLPPAQYLQTSSGKAAYYDLPPTKPEARSNGNYRVLVIHGVQTPAIGMLPLTEALQASNPHVHFVLCDLWGHGLSDTPIVPYEPCLFLQLVDNLLDHLAWPTAHLIGFSFGGALTSQYVALHPARVQSFVLVAPAGLFRYESDFSEEEKAHLRGDDEVAAREWTINWLGRDTANHEDWQRSIQDGEIVAAAVKEWQMRENPGHAASVVAIVRDGGIMDKHDVFREAIGSGKHCFAVVGGEDPVCNEQQLKEVGMTNVAVVEKAGHEVIRANAEEVARLISEFWAKNTLV